MKSLFFLGWRGACYFASAVRILFFGLLLAGTSACRHEAAAANNTEPPPGQAWLTEQQIRDAKIVVEPASEQDTDDTILTSGRVVFDDTRVAPIMSPVTAPIDGEVITRNVSPGVEVQGQYGGGTAVELFTIGELEKVWVIADVYEMDLARVRVGSPVKVKIVAYKDKIFESKLDYVAGKL